MSISWQPLVELIDRHESFLITSHCRADCDAAGSEIALALALESLGKRALVVNGDPLPEHIAFIDPQGRVLELGVGAPLETLRQCEALIVVDTSAWGQLGPMADVVRAFSGPRAVVDHHVSADDLGALVFKDATAEATGRLILELCEALGVAITPEIAAPLFAAIATDTGWFRFSSVTDATFLALAKLTAAGASPPRLFSLLFEQHSLARLHLRGRILDHVRSECNGRLMWTYVTAEDFAVTGASKTDTEDAINALLTVAGAEVAALFVELEPEVTKASLRSRNDFDVRAVAEQFGGGGHRAAAGISYRGPRPAAQEAILDALRAGLG
ncbi:MAG: bifunctional oligoribonuclease/PAP phosphatase NrnA [Pirellulales bacterium]|nr:bifunctional oligoribonuclease/PAP phosphatase NrnA [Pirellulales bacterium]